MSAQKSATDKGAEGANTLSADPLLFTPVIIIGAGRSGTNILRDCLTVLPGFATWNCDEIDPVWRHGNLSWPDDAIPPERATPAVRCFIRRAFRLLWQRMDRPAFVVEKTCANSLRVPFVDRVVPEARYLYLVRDGADIVASAARRWQGDLELPGLPYYWAKIRNAPKLDLPVHGLRFVRNRIALMAGRKKRMKVWGPRWPGMEAHADASLQELCARQWAASVEAADRAFAEMDPGRVLKIRYEEMVAEPAAVLTRIAGFLRAPVDPGQVEAIAGNVRVSSVGKGRRLLDDAAAHDTAMVREVLAPVLARHGYEV